MSQTHRDPSASALVRSDRIKGVHHYTQLALPLISKICMLSVSGRGTEARQEIPQSGFSLFKVWGQGLRKLPGCPEL